MLDPISDLLARPDVRTSPPASPADIAAVARHYDAPLPEELVRLWQAADGADLGSIDAHLIGASELLLMFEELLGFGGFVQLGFLPLLDDNTSNYVGPCVTGPLAPRVIWVPHDDDLRIVYRDLAGFFRDLPAALEQDEIYDLFVRDLPGDYAPDRPRTAADRSAARALLSTTDIKSDDWLPMSQVHAVLQLLDASCLTEWAALLETHHFIRRDVLPRLEAMDDPAIQALLARDREAYDEFVNRVAKAARAAGFMVGSRREKDLYIRDGWYNLDFAFHRRQIPDAMPRLMTWFRDRAEGRNPNARPGHFYADD